MKPLKGPRFKCTTLPDYDLCGECYAKKGAILNDDSCDHQFTCIATDWQAAIGGSPFADAWKKGASMVKGAIKGLFGRKGCKGKGKGGGWHGGGWDGCKGGGWHGCKGKGGGWYGGKGRAAHGFTC